MGVEIGVAAPARPGGRIRENHRRRVWTDTSPVIGEAEAGVPQGDDDPERLSREEAEALVGMAEEEGREEMIVVAGKQ